MKKAIIFCSCQETLALKKKKRSIGSLKEGASQSGNVKTGGSETL